MATIPESFIVDINITRKDLDVGVDGFGIVNIVGISDVIGQNERIRFYSSSDEVLEDFGSVAEEFKAAEAFFGQNPRPQKLAISRRLTGDVAGFIIGNQITGSLASFQAISDAEFTIDIDGTLIDILAINYTTALSFADIATLTQAALNAEAPPGFSGAVVTYDAITGKLKILSGTAGASSTVSFLTPVSGGLGTDVSGTLFLNALSGEQVGGVTAGATIVDELGKIIAVNNTWYWLTFTKETRDSTDVTDVAAFIQTELKEYITATNDADTYNDIITTDITSLIKAGGYSRTTPVYHDVVAEYPDVSVAARMAAVDFNAPDSVITAAFKDLPGITPVNLTEGQLDVILSKNGNSFVIIRSRRVFFEGKTGSGEFIDIINTTDWLEVEMRQEVFDLIVDADRVPFDDVGIQQVGNAMTKSLNKAVFNGMLAGGFDDDNNPIPAFTISLPRAFDVSAVDKAARKLTGVSFTGTYSDAIHFATITGTLSVQLGG